MDFIINNIGKLALAVSALAVLIMAIKHYAKIKAFLSEVKVELGKVSWSTRQEVMGATAVVITITVILTLYVGIVDFSLSRCLALFIK